MTDPDKPLKEGYLLMPPKSSFILVSKPWQKKFCRLYHSSKQGIERLEIFENEDDLKNLTILTLENCIKICEDVVKNQNHVFVVVTKTGTAHPNTHQFATTGHNDMVEWISAFQTVAFKDNATETSIEEDNDLYCSSNDIGIFSVKLVASKATRRCGLEPGPYMLAVTPSALQLHRMSDSQVEVTWPYTFIRKYGYHNGGYKSGGHRFTFEAGRSCSTGEGLFSFEHSNQQEIFRCISSKMNHMRQLLNSAGGDAASREGSRATLLCGDTLHFQAAMGMMARSRSPLPPSPTSSQNFDSDFSSLGSLKPLGGVSCDNSPTDCPQRMFSSGVGALNSVSSSHISLLERHSTLTSSNEKRGTSQGRVLSRERSRSSGRSLSLERPRTLSLLPTSPPPPTERPPPPPKPKLGAKPEKPPRKVPPCKTDLPGGAQPPPYDEVEVKTDAWRTQGLTSDFHSERPPYDAPLRPGAPSPSDPQNSKMFTVRTPDAQSQKQLFINCTTGGDYDTLQHLGTTSKVTSPGYRQVGPILTLAHRSKSSETLLQDNVIDTNKTDQAQLSLCSAKV
uniref:Docking protein 3 n=1 Tax=Cacopsylla melanoneura TaxID=428564 RepID=A0A8D8SU22_9HEMI